MTDPYKILGVPKGADDEKIKAAYRELVHKYHPDKYANHPLSDFATEKMKEINDAYDRISNQVILGNRSKGRIIFGVGGNAEHCEVTSREKERRDKESLAKWVSAYEKYRENEHLEEKRRLEEERLEKERREEELREEERRKIDAENLAKYIRILLSLHE